MFVTKYRRQILDDPMLRVCEHTMRDVAHALGADVTEFNGEADHVHLLLAYPPSIAVSTLVNRLKGVCARQLRHQFTGRPTAPA